MLNALLKMLKLPQVSLVATAVIAGFFVFAPAEALQFLAILQLAQDYRPVWSVVLIVSVSILSARHIISAYSRHQHAKAMRQRLRALSEQEKEVLRAYRDGNTRCLCHRLDNGGAQALISAGILSLPDGAYTYDPAIGVPLILHETAWKRLQKHPNRLD